MSLLSLYQLSSCGILFSFLIRSTYSTIYLWTMFSFASHYYAFDRAPYAPKKKREKWTYTLTWMRTLTKIFLLLPLLLLKLIKFIMSEFQRDRFNINFPLTYVRLLLRMLLPLSIIALSSTDFYCFISPFAFLPSLLVFNVIWLPFAWHLTGREWVIEDKNIQKVGNR